MEIKSRAVELVELDVVVKDPKTEKNVKPTLRIVFDEATGFAVRSEIIMN